MIHTSPLIWLSFVAVILFMLIIDLGVFHKKSHTVSFKEAIMWSIVWIAMAMIFSLVILQWRGQEDFMLFVTGYVIEKSLSVDNLFVFVIILSAFAVPRIHQKTVLQIGIIGALILRFIFIVIGAALIMRFSWIFFIFGAFLVYTAFKLMKHNGDEFDPRKSKVLKYAEKLIPITPEFHEGKFRIKVANKYFYTPMFIVMIAIFTTDIVFALDSIPAIFGLTKDPYIVFTANAFALMGLRQLYFLLDGLLAKLIYLGYGLAIILGFIGVKMLLHAAHENGFPQVVEIPISISLIVIVATITITVIASLIQAKRHPELVHKPGLQD
jgi:tellurite resistance protein TerC